MGFARRTFSVRTNYFRRPYSSHFQPKPFSRNSALTSLASMLTIHHLIPPLSPLITTCLTTLFLFFRNIRRSPFLGSGSLLPHLPSDSIVHLHTLAYRFSPYLSFIGTFDVVPLLLSSNPPLHHAHSYHSTILSEHSLLHVPLSRLAMCAVLHSRMPCL